MKQADVMLMLDQAGVLSRQREVEDFLYRYRHRHPADAWMVTAAKREFDRTERFIADCLQTFTKKGVA